MTKYCFFLLVMLLTDGVFALAQNNTTLSVRGKVYRFINEIDQFKGYKEQEGTVIQPIPSNYGLSKISNGKNVIILFEKFIPAGNGKVNYQILDTVNIGKFSPDKIVIMSGCAINKQNEPEIVGLVKNAEKGEVYQAVKSMAG